MPLWWKPNKLRREALQLLERGRGPEAKDSGRPAKPYECCPGSPETSGGFSHSLSGPSLSTSQRRGLLPRAGEHRFWPGLPLLLREKASTTAASSSTTNCLLLGQRVHIAAQPWYADDGQSAQALHLSLMPSFSTSSRPLPSSADRSDLPQPLFLQPGRPASLPVPAEALPFASPSLRGASHNATLFTK